jgi:hypothetical protein
MAVVPGIHLPNMSNLHHQHSWGDDPDGPPNGPVLGVEHDYQRDLLRDGFVVIPTALGSEWQKLQQAQVSFDQHFRESPELLNAQPENPAWKNVLGGFAAMGNPSSFHHPFVRAMREMCEAAVLDSDALPLNGRRLEQCFDRIMRRIPGEVTKPESWHRDEALNTQPGDDIFGGWINLDAHPQYFSCAPRTHTEQGARDRNAGFAKITDANHKQYYQQIADNHGRVTIPPGHVLIFYERLVHEVTQSTATYTMRRLFLGWRATSALEPLFGSSETDRWILTQAPPKIKSGQKPAIYPSAYSNFPRNFQTLTTFSKLVFAPECLYNHEVKTGEYKGTIWVRVKASMLGLWEYGLTMHQSYDRYERALLFPSTTVVARTFDSPVQRVHFRLVSPEQWQAHVTNPIAMDAYGNATRRPRPERYVENLEVQF